MFFNIPKCKHLHIGREENTIDCVMVPNNEELKIKKANSEKDLGVEIDKKLLFREHTCTYIQQSVHSKQNTGSNFPDFHVYG